MCGECRIYAVCSLSLWLSAVHVLRPRLKRSAFMPESLKTSWRPKFVLVHHFYVALRNNASMPRIYMVYYSHPPFRVGMAPCPFCCIPCLCCGPPVIFIRRPTTCCCINCRPCCGETIFSSPSNCFGLKCCLCCGTPCHMIYYARPLVINVRNGRLFLSNLKAMSQEYHE